MSKDPFACFLQRQGFGVVTFDYRGIGDSRPPSLKGCSAQMHEWGQQDIAGVLHWIEQEVQPARTFIRVSCISMWKVAVSIRKPLFRGKMKGLR